MSKVHVLTVKQKTNTLIFVRSVVGSLKKLVKILNVQFVANLQQKKKQNITFFKLKNFGEPLSKWLDENENLQKDVKKYVQNWIKSGLIDWDITRDIPWGVPVPLDGAKGQSVLWLV